MRPSAYLRGVCIIICGGDEAGRGAVLGPLVLSVVVVQKSQEKKLSEIGVRDSKLLSRERRDSLFNKINKIALEVLVDKITPEDINNAMRNKISLNELEAVRFSKLFDRAQNESSVLYLDSPDVKQEKFGMRVNMYSVKPTRVVGIKSSRDKGVRYTRIISEHKADAKYPVVSAASIIAKVTRDAEIERLGSALNLDIGSGYPSDRYTIEAIKDNIKNAEFKKHIREYWITIDAIKQSKMQEYMKGSGSTATGKADSTQ